jgi:ABC-type multidrug transport system fused ATPase/permease subunit
MNIPAWRRGFRRTLETINFPIPGQQRGIVFENVKLRYRPGLPLVLKGLDIHILLVADYVVGRTGAGKVCISPLLHFIATKDLSPHPSHPHHSPTKSTLMVALMRIVELSEGKILIDRHDIRDVGLSIFGAHCSHSTRPSVLLVNCMDEFGPL